MKLGIIADIHEDLQSLQKALCLLRNQGADKVVCAGDIVAAGERGDAIVELLQRFCIPCVQGNHDENVIKHWRLFQRLKPKKDSVPLSRYLITYLQQLPKSLHYLWHGKRIQLAHCTPSNSQQSLTVYHSQKQYRKAMLRADADIIILGHTHIPLKLEFEGIMLVNPGAVSNQKLRDSHTCAILDIATSDFVVYDIASGTTGRT